uniref:DYW domain-containing protein n=1 Tax=Oryza meridionalis TaxID=40149 RepID=A0A0E0DQP0_9ORYZ
MRIHGEEFLPGSTGALLCAFCGRGLGDVMNLPIGEHAAAWLCGWMLIDTYGKRDELMRLSGDSSHPMMAATTETLKHLTMEMRRLCFAPRTDHALNDVEEHEKGDILSVHRQHSEKLAVALAINNHKSWNTPSATKFMSSFERREIYVRDTIRFHQFKE